MTYGQDSLNSLSLTEFESLPVWRINNFVKLMEAQRKREKKYADAIRNGKVPH